MQQTTKPYFFIYTDHDFYFQTIGNTFPKKQSICINRLTSKVEQISPQQFQAKTYHISAKNSETVYLIIGIITIIQEPYLCLVTKCEYAGKFMNDQIFLIRDIKFIPFKHRFLYGSIDQSEGERILDGLKNGILADNFYFCYHQDITLTYSKQLTKNRRPTQRKYFWNEDLLKIFARHKLPLTWRIPIMQGYVSEIKQKTNFFSYEYLTLSRRSKYMSGTRFNSRGIDHSFNTANFVETEQIFMCHNYIFSHVSLRGSAPLFWSQSGFGAQIKFSKQNQQENQLIMQKHFELLEHEYGGNIVAINLLSKTKSPQKQLKNRYQFYYYKVVKGNYLYFDLNQQISKQKESAHLIIQNFIKTNMELLAGDGNFFCIDTNTKKIITIQKTIPRINCLDCIDRTNVIMARTSELFLNEVQFFINAHTRQQQQKLELGRKFDTLLIENWAKLGNKLSQIYCGTQSVASHLTRKQNNSFFSFFSSSLKSINRYYNANMSDSAKQQCLDYFLCKKQQNSTSMQYFQDNITNQILKNQEIKYCTHEQYGIYVVTWNCNMVDPTALTQKDLYKFLNFPRQNIDFIIICLQEMVQLNSYNVILGNNETITQAWRKVIYDHLHNEKIGSQEQKFMDRAQQGRRGIKKIYDYLTGYDLVGISTFVFANPKVIKRVHQMEWFQIKTGFKGSLGNKGAIILFFYIDSTPITVINCHLAAGQAKSSERIQDIQYIHREAIKDRIKRRFFDNSEFRFFIGDCNFRLQAKNQSVREMLYSIQKQDQVQKLSRQQLSLQLSPLLQKDQFHINRSSGSLSSYYEPEIYFLPTYKYVKKQKTYDTKRTPSWCDRILFHTKQKLKFTAMKYSDIDIYLSDHKPVCGMYKFLCKQEDTDKKKKLIQMYYDS